MHQAQEAQQADFIARVSEVGPGCIDVAGGATLLPTDVCLQHQAAGGLSVLLQPAHTTYAEMEEEGNPGPQLYLCIILCGHSLCGKLLTNPQHSRTNAPSN